MSVFSITMGSENVEMASAKVHAFVTVNGEEMHITKPQTRQYGVRVMRLGAEMDAVPGMQSVVCGRWRNYTLEVPPRLLIKMFVTSKAGFGSFPETHAVFVLLDDSADMVELHFALSGNHRCAFSHVEAVGRFRFLSLSEAEALGARVPAAFRSQFKPLNDRHSLITQHRVLSTGVRAVDAARALRPASASVMPPEASTEGLDVPVAATMPDGASEPSEVAGPLSAPLSVAAPDSAHPPFVSRRRLLR